ncbi:hypothetical protein D3C72_1231960 [compost metagenome]
MRIIQKIGDHSADQSTVDHRPIVSIQTLNHGDVLFFKGHLVKIHDLFDQITDETFFKLHTLTAIFSLSNISQDLQEAQDLV